MPDPVTILDAPVAKPDPPPKAREAKGVIPLRTARAVAFAIMTLTLAACTLMSLLAVWDYMHSDVLWRSMSTVAIVLVATGLFTVVNEYYGRER